LSQLKTTNTPAAKLYNWNLLIKELEVMRAVLKAENRNWH
jgi:hypothetical protein